jgi:hypothetical protein
MDAELQALDAALLAAQAQGLQVTLVDQVDGVWTAGASDNIFGEALVTGTGATRTAALLALIAALEAR